MTAGRLSPSNPGNRRPSRNRRHSTISFLLRRRTIFRPGLLLSPVLKLARADGSAMSRRREKEDWWLPERRRTGSLTCLSPATICLGKTRVLYIYRVWLLLSQSKSGQATEPAIMAISSASPLLLDLQGRLTKSFPVANVGDGSSRLCSQAASDKSMPGILRRMKQKKEC